MPVEQSRDNPPNHHEHSHLDDGHQHPLHQVSVSEEQLVPLVQAAKSLSIKVPAPVTIVIITFGIMAIITSIFTKT